jgi:hypothetical protein
VRDASTLRRLKQSFIYQASKFTWNLVAGKSNALGHLGVL